MEYQKCIIAVLLGLLFSKPTLSNKLPAYIKKCRFGDEPCLIKTVQKIFQDYPKGLPEIGVPPLDAIKIEDITLLSSPGPISITYKLKNQVVKGFENATITRMRGFVRDPTLNKLEVGVQLPRLLQQGNYELLSRRLIVESNSDGTSESDLQNVRITATLKVIMEYRNNKRYLKIYHLSPQIEMDRWILRVDSLYKENTDLTIVLNRVINENWLEFWNEIEPTIVPAYARSFAKLLGAAFENVAYDDLFLPDAAT